MYMVCSFKHCLALIIHYNLIYHAHFLLFLQPKSSNQCLALLFYEKSKYAQVIQFA